MCETTLELKDLLPAQTASVAPTNDPAWLALEVGNDSQTAKIGLKTLDCQALALALLVLSTSQARELEAETVLKSVQEHFEQQLATPVEALGARYDANSGTLLITTGIGLLRFQIRPDSQEEARAYLQGLL